ncbi:MAG: hypothetical protein HDS46_05120 [Bacteroides sp.]|nr:hypothetical protein [Bacteroides sp.]MDE6039016.1 hypothetical protein [Paramuribaculum sp.]
MQCQLPPHHSPELLFAPVQDSCELTVEIDRADYSASAIARAVEDADAHLLNLNVTAREPLQEGCVAVELRVSHRNAGAVGRSLERYGYRVTDIREGFDANRDTMLENYNELMLSIFRD